MSISAGKQGQIITPGDEPLALSAKFTNSVMTVYLMDGRSLAIPLDRVPSLQKATPAQRANYYLSAGGRGLHWPDIDEDLSVAGLVRSSQHRLVKDKSVKR